MRDDLSEHQAKPQMLDAVTEYGRAFDVRFNREKSKVLTVERGHVRVTRPFGPRTVADACWTRMHSLA